MEGGCATVESVLGAAGSLRRTLKISGAPGRVIAVVARAAATLNQRNAAIEEELMTALERWEALGAR